MSLELQHWPQYDNPGEALRQEAGRWRSERREIAERRYDGLDGQLGSAVTRLVIGIVDANERPDRFAIPDIYAEHFTENSGGLLLVNYDTQTPPERTEELVDTIKQRRDSAGIPLAIAVVGYHRRMFGELKSNAWDLAVVHGLRHGIEAPIIGVSNDYDMSGVSPSYWNRMTKNEFVDQPARTWSSKAVPELFGDPDCIVNRHIRYLFAMRTLMTRITGKPLMYGASTATSLHTYAAAGEGWTGPYSATFHDGVQEPTQLVLNIKGRASGVPVLDPDATEKVSAAVRAHARSVPEDAFVRVSARRETMEYATFLSGSPYPMELVNTSVDNAYRHLSADELASLAESIKPDLEKAREEITRLEKNFRSKFDGEQVDELAGAFKAARQEIGLPEPDL